MKLSKKITRMLMVVAISIVTLFASQASFSTALAQEVGTYTLTALPSYANPLTGAIEDRGQNAAIGQGMTESVIDATALFEVYDDEQSFVTLRCNLMDNIGKVQFSYQTDSEGEFTPIEHTVMQESQDGTSADLRFELPGSESLVRAEMFVTPMGREIVFFVSFADPVLGSADFVVTEPQVVEEATPVLTVADKGVATAAPQQVAAPQQTAGNNLQLIVLAGAIIATVAVIALIGFLIYRKKVAHAKP